VISVVGSVNWDLRVRVSALPKSGETALGSDLSQGLGGKGANQAVAAARAGAPVQLIGAVGADQFGALARTALEHERLNLNALQTVAFPTGAALIGVDDAGNNSILVAAGANARWTFDPAVLVGTALLLTQLELPLATARAALQAGRALGARTALNASPVPAEFSLDLLALADVLVVNEPEAARLVPGAGGGVTGGAEAARTLLEHCGAVVITLGRRGAVWADQTGQGHVPAPEVRAVDTTGAGDAFAGALCTALHEGAALVVAVRFACAAGALAATRPGAALSAPRRSDIDALLRGEALGLPLVGTP
jgi:ribokinase